MIRHLALGDNSFGRLRALKIRLIKQKIQLGGNANLKIYGTLECKSGKRMKAKNRVFFEHEEEAIKAPCLNQNFPCQNAPLILCSLLTGK